MEQKLNSLGIRTRTFFCNRWLSTNRVLKNIAKKWDRLSKDDKDSICNYLSNIKSI